MVDKDLYFLEKCTNEQLQLLADFIVYDTDGKTRHTEALSTTQNYRINYPKNMKALVPNIVNELQLFGGNSVLNAVRGHGVPYREILETVCDKLDVNFNKNISTELLEHYLLQKFLIMSIDKKSEEDVRHLSEKLSKEALKSQIGLLKAGSPLFIKLTTILVIRMAAMAGLKQVAGFAAKLAGGRAFAILAGPIGWVISGLWAAYDIAGPAFRVIIPCTITIAYLRSIYDKTEEELNEILK